jgi:hypothetical protein
MLLEMLTVMDQQDAVAGGDPQHRQDERAERKDAATNIGRQHAADQGRGQEQEDDGRQAPAAEGRCRRRNMALAATSEKPSRRR